MIAGNVDAALIDQVAIARAGRYRENTIIGDRHLPGVDHLRAFAKSENDNSSSRRAVDCAGVDDDAASPFTEYR